MKLKIKWGTTLNKGTLNGAHCICGSLNCQHPEYLKEDKSITVSSLFMQFK